MLGATGADSKKPVISHILDHRHKMAWPLELWVHSRADYRALDKRIRREWRVMVLSIL